MVVTILTNRTWLSVDFLQYGVISRTVFKPLSNIYDGANTYSDQQHLVINLLTTNVPII